MRGLPLVPELLRQLFRRPATNLFPAKYLPRSVRRFLRDAGEGRARIHPPVPTPPQYRGKIAYDRESCIGCTLCVKVCPAHAIDFIPVTKKVRIWVGQCIFCSQCTSICPKNCLSMTEEFLLAGEDRYAENLIVE
ncbi:MAG: 4Fe-4S dicluster domain-containing protein [Methanolinea sp.]|nr:4Fe-4S dicluster domain-containing protein [Methanolinea sp.]